MRLQRSILLYCSDSISMRNCGLSIYKVKKLRNLPACSYVLHAPRDSFLCLPYGKLSASNPSASHATNTTTTTRRYIHGQPGIGWRAPLRYRMLAGLVHTNNVYNSFGKALVVPILLG